MKLVKEVKSDSSKWKKRGSGYTNGWIWRFFH